MLLTFLMNLLGYCGAKHPSMDVRCRCQVAHIPHRRHWYRRKDSLLVTWSGL